MKQFQTIEKIDTGILYALELASSISVLLLAFGLIASMANVLTKGGMKLLKTPVHAPQANAVCERFAQECPAGMPRPSVDCSGEAALAAF